MPLSLSLSLQNCASDVKQITLGSCPSIYRSSGSWTGSGGTFFCLMHSVTWKYRHQLWMQRKTKCTIWTSVHQFNCLQVSASFRGKYFSISEKNVSHRKHRLLGKKQTLKVKQRLKERPFSPLSGRGKPFTYTIRRTTSGQNEYLKMSKVETKTRQKEE